MNITRNGYLNTEASAARIDQRMKEWVMAHADRRDHSRARRALSNSRSVARYQHQGLHVMSSRLSRHPMRRCVSHYVTHRNPDGTGYCYQAAFHLFTLEDTRVSGLVGNLYVNDRGEDRRSLPWNPEERAQSFEDIFLEAERERYQALDTAAGRHMVPEDELPRMPGVYLLYRQEEGQEEGRQESLQGRLARARVMPITERGILDGASQVADSELRSWLGSDYRLVSILESGERRLAFPQEEDLAEAVAQRVAEVEEHDACQSVCSIVRNLIIVAAMAETDREREVLGDLDEATRLALTGAGHAPITSEAELAASQPQEDHWPDREETEAPAPGAQQERIDELETRLARRELELEDARGQVANLQEALRYAGAADRAPEEEAASQDGREDGAAAGRANTVLEAITDPERFPHLRFLAKAQEVSEYGKPRPSGREIISALDAIDTLAGRYYDQDGKVGDWTEHFRLPGWTYSPRDSATTMGKHQEERTFTDHESRQKVVIDRHLTYPTGSYGGMQIYFDKDDRTRKFIVAYIGTHKSVAYQRS